MHGICIFTSVGEWVVSSENGTKSKVETYEGVDHLNGKLRVLGETSWGRSPPPPPPCKVKDPDFNHG